MRERERPGREAQIAALAAASWTERTPPAGGRLTAVVADLADSTRERLLVASPGGGVWLRDTTMSPDWIQRAMYSMPEDVVTRLEWDQQVTTPRRLWIVGQNSLGYSTDLAANVTMVVNSGGAPGDILPRVHGQEHPRPFAQMIRSGTRWVFSSYGCYSLYYSNGLAFSHHTFFTGANEDNCIGALAADPQGGRLYFATLKASPGAPVVRLFRTATWNATAPTLPTNPTPIDCGMASCRIVGGAPLESLTVTGTSGISDRLVTTRSSSVWRTTNGTGWSATTSLASTAFTMVHSGSGEELFAGSGAPWRNPDLGGGGAWSNLTSTPPLYTDIRGIFTDPAGPGPYRLWATTDWSAYGANANIARWYWSPGTTPTMGAGVSATGLRVWQGLFAGLIKGVSSGSDRIVYSGAWDSGVARYDDTLDSSAYATPFNGDVFAFQTCPQLPSRAYVWRLYGPGPDGYRIDNAQTTTPTLTGFTFPPPAFNDRPLEMSHRNLMAIDPTSPTCNIVYFAGGNNAIRWTSNGGVSFNDNIAGPSGTTQLASLLVDDTGILRAGTQQNGIHSYAGSGSWTALGMPITPAPQAVMGLAYTGPVAGRVWWAATTQGVYRLNTTTSQWERKHWTGIAYSYSDIAVDPTCAKRIYIGMGFAGGTGRTFHRGNVLETVNEGASWTSLTSGWRLQLSPITDVQPDHYDARYLFAASYGHGLWFYDRGATPTCP